MMENKKFTKRQYHDMSLLKRDVLSLWSHKTHKSTDRYCWKPKRVKRNKHKIEETELNSILTKKLEKVGKVRSEHVLEYLAGTIALPSSLQCPKEIPQVLTTNKSTQFTSNELQIRIIQCQQQGINGESESRMQINEIMPDVPGKLHAFCSLSQSYIEDETSHSQMQIEPSTSRPLFLSPLTRNSLGQVDSDESMHCVYTRHVQRETKYASFQLDQCRIDIKIHSPRIKSIKTSPLVNINVFT